jgi:hypothetical protein
MRTTPALYSSLSPAVVAAAAMAGLLAACAQPAPLLLPVDEQGAVLHPASRFAFPAQVGPFERSNVKHHDPQGEALSADYTLAGTAVITVYVYPEPPADEQAGDLLERHVQAMKGAVVQNSALRLLSEGPVDITQNGRAHQGRRLTLEYRGSFGGIAQELFAKHYLFMLGRHFIQYRVIYPAAEDAKVSPLVPSFLKDLRWPGE